MSLFRFAGACLVIAALSALTPSALAHGGGGGGGGGHGGGGGGGGWGGGHSMSMGGSWGGHGYSGYSGRAYHNFATSARTITRREPIRMATMAITTTGLTMAAIGGTTAGTGAIIIMAAIWPYYWFPWYGFGWWPDYYYNYYCPYCYDYGTDGGYVYAEEANPGYTTAYLPPAEEAEAAPNPEGAGESSLGEQYFASDQGKHFFKSNMPTVCGWPRHAAVEMPQNVEVHNLLMLDMFAVGNYRGAAMEAHSAASSRKTHGLEHPLWLLR